MDKRADDITNPSLAELDELESVVVRFAGDSGDGMQLTGSQFTASTALAGHDLSTFPDFPAEIRAPAGTTFGVSAFQINFGSDRVLTAGDEPDVLVAMNPAALKVSIDNLRPGGLVVVDTGSFSARNQQKAGYESSPLEDDSLSSYRVIRLDITAYTLEAVKAFGLSNKDALRCKNMWTLGLMLWMFGRQRKPITEWLKTKFKKMPEVAKSNIAALNAGHAFGETAELSGDLNRYEIRPAHIEPGTYRTVTGSQSLAWGLVAGAQCAGLKLMFGSYPITPASTLLHLLAAMKQFGIVTFQAEDEIAAICAAIGASYAGSLGVTSSFVGIEMLAILWWRLNHLSWKFFQRFKVGKLPRLGRICDIAIRQQDHRRHIFCRRWSSSGGSRRHRRYDRSRNFSRDPRSGAPIPAFRAWPKGGKAFPDCVRRD